MKKNPEDKKRVWSVVCTTVGEIEDWIEQFGPAGRGMLETDTPIHSYDSSAVGAEFMWSAQDQKWYISELP